MSVKSVEFTDCVELVVNIGNKYVPPCYETLAMTQIETVILDGEIVLGVNRGESFAVFL